MTLHFIFTESSECLHPQTLNLLQHEAFEVIAEGFPPATAAACCRELARGAGAAGMVGGQVDDLAMESRAGAGTLDELEFLHARKTGALFRAALRMGAWAAGARQQLDALDVYGRCFGLAFQITDDLLDVEGYAERAGKRVGKDAARGKLTYPGLLGAAESRRRAERLGREARDHLAPLGPPAARLLSLIAYVLERDR